jgi:galactosyltransferase
MVTEKPRWTQCLHTWARSSRGSPTKSCSLFFRFLIGVFAIIIVYLAFPFTTPTHHEPYVPPSNDYQIHGKSVSEEAETHKTLYPLYPFPPTPMVLTEEVSSDTSHQPWLAAIISSAFEPERRMLIRTTWIHKFKNTVPFDARFVVSNPGPRWVEILQAENRTFGDLIVLDHLQEDDFTANTIKTIELFKYLINHGFQYEFVSKLDTDLFLNARRFWDVYLRPRLTADNKANITRTGIGELYYHNDLVFLHGSMYTYTWDIIEELVQLQDRFRVVTSEDVLAPTLLLKARRMVNIVNFLGSEKFDYLELDSRGDGMPWARQATHPNATEHALYGDNPIAIHNLKKNDEYLKIASAFDQDGIKPMPPGRDLQWAPLWMLWVDFWHALGGITYLTPRVKRIPDYFFSQSSDGDWIVDGIWNLGKTKEGHQERIP